MTNNTAEQALVQKPKIQGAADPERRQGKAEDQVTRLNVNINAETASLLRRVAKARGISYTEAVRRAIAVWAFIEDEFAANHRVQIVDPVTDTKRELVVV